MDSLPTAEPTSVNKNIRTWTILCHASAFLGFFLPAVGHIVGPLIVWAAKKDESSEINEHGKESLNFQISMLIYTAALGVITFILLLSSSDSSSFRSSEFFTFSTSSL